MIISDRAFNHESEKAIKLDCTESKPLPLPAWLIRWLVWGLTLTPQLTPAMAKTTTYVL